ncbi:MAG TPA: YoaK family protein [Myxococcaceae bacterium]|nr:YoaK family protein [Myxococcaceae bacterium]
MGPLKSPGPRRDRLVFLLTWIGGYVDAFGFLVLDRTFTANMSGNSVDLGVRIGRDPATAFQRFWPILMFVLGVSLTGALVQVAKRRRSRSLRTAPLGLELLLLSLLFVFSPLHEVRQEAIPAFQFYGLIALAAFAMGLQNAISTRFAGRSVRTTHITGTLTRAGSALGHYLIWVVGQLRRRVPLRQVFRLTDPHHSPRSAGGQGALWMVYVVGALCCAFIEARLGRDALLMPLAALGGVLIAVYRWSRVGAPAAGT